MCPRAAAGVLKTARTALLSPCTSTRPPRRQGPRPGRQTGRQPEDDLRVRSPCERRLAAAVHAIDGNHDGPIRWGIRSAIAARSSTWSPDARLTRSDQLQGFRADTTHGSAAPSVRWSGRRAGSAADGVVGRDELSERHLRRSGRAEWRAVCPASQTGWMSSRPGVGNSSGFVSSMPTHSMPPRTSPCWGSSTV